MFRGSSHILSKSVVETWRRLTRWILILIVYVDKTNDSGMVSLEQWPQDKQMTQCVHFGEHWTVFSERSKALTQGMENPNFLKSENINHKNERKTMPNGVVMRRDAWSRHQNMSFFSTARYRLGTAGVWCFLYPDAAR